MAFCFINFESLLLICLAVSGIVNHDTIDDFEYLIWHVSSAIVSMPTFEGHRLIKMVMSNPTLNVYVFFRHNMIILYVWQIEAHGL